MNKIILATRNAGKLREIKEILSGLSFEILNLDEAGIEKDIEESGKTYFENALIKAEEIYRISGQMVISDDSGLEVEALDNRPGVFSARYAESTKERIRKILDEMQGIPFEKRRAKFVCVVCLITHSGEHLFFEGRVEGFISLKPAGENGFGFDPVFYVPEFDRTMAELSPDIKNRISHRAIAFEKLKKYLQDMKM